MKTKITNCQVWLCKSIAVWIMVMLTVTLYAQDPAQYGTPFAGVPDPRDVNMYQVHTRIFSAAGNFQGVISRLDQIQALGINTLYLMPHYPMGTDSRASGSPYCIKDFKGVGAEYGNLTSLRQLVDGAHARGMAVILDFVVNQTSFDHPWITQHPDWYQRDGAGNIIALFPDVAALNMNNTAMRAAMIDAMRYWIFAANVDGFRCDYANNAPVSFWSAVISNLRGISSHRLLMFAEGDRRENFQAGFDMNFGDRWFWEALRPVATGTAATQMQATTDYEYALSNGTQQVVRYTTNHDIVGRNDLPILPFQVFQNHNGVVANFLVSAYMRGVPFLMSGQEVDFSSFVAYPWYNPKINWGANTGAAADFTKILNFRTASNAIRRGTMTNYSNNDVCAFTKISGTEKVVVMVNMRNNGASFSIPSAMAGSYTDAYTGAAVTLTSGATQSLSNYQYRVLKSGGGSCPITPYLVVNGGAWQQTASASLAIGGTITIGPQPTSGGTWSWTGPNGFTASTREITRSNIQANQGGNYIATYNNGAGCTSTQTFTITVTGGNNLTVTPSSFSFGSGASSGTVSVTANVTWTVTDNQTWITTSISSGSNNGSFTVNATANTGAARSGIVTVTGGGFTRTINVSQSAPAATTYYTIRNRWKGTYLYDAGANVGYGTTVANNNYKWVKETIDATYFWLRNLGTGEYMHIENQTGSVQCTSVDKTWWSSQWSQDNVDGTYIRIRNRWQTGNIVHVEGQTGSAQYAGGQDGWYSAQWQFTVTSARIGAEEHENGTELNTASIEVFPNPAKGKELNITISELDENKEATLFIHDANGKVAFEGRVKRAAKINHDLPAGLYLIRIRAGQINATKKLIVE